MRFLIISTMHKKDHRSRARLAWIRRSRVSRSAIDPQMGQDVRLVGNLMQQRNCMFVVVCEPVSELLEGCSNQSRADVLGQIERLTEVHENASREFGNAVQHELGCQGNSGGAVAMIGLAGFTLLVVVRWSGPVVIVFEKFCNSAFDFENANLSKKNFGIRLNSR